MTRLDLLVALAMLLLLAILFSPVRAAPQSAGKGMVCLNNLRQLILAWQLYASEHQDNLVMNYHGGSAQGGAVALDNTSAPWALGWEDWTSSSDNTNTLFTTNPRYSRLAPYLGFSAKVFKCPSDQFLSPVQRSRGWRERARSVALNIAVGAGNAEEGPWDPIYKHAKKTSDFIYPGPRDTFVFLDEHPDSINDPGLFNPHQSSWVDQPASYHNGAAGFSFVDGHCEMHKWEGSLAQPRAMRVKYNNGIDAPAASGDPDIHWVSYRAGRLSERSY